MVNRNSPWLIQQSFCSGSVRGMPVHGLLTVKLSAERFVVGTLFDIELVDLTIRDIIAVELLRNIINIGFKVVYKVPIGEDEVIIRTRQFKQWGEHFRALHVEVKPYRGWFG